MLIEKYCSIKVLMVLTLLFCSYGCGSDENVFVFNPKDGFKYKEFVSVDKTITTLSGGQKSRSKIDLENEVEVSETGKGFEYVVTTVKAQHLVDGVPINNPILDGMVLSPIVYDIAKSGEIRDVRGYDKVLEKALSRMTPQVIEQNKNMLSENNLKAQEMVNWKDKLENVLGRSVEIGSKWADVKNIDLPTGGVSQYYVATKVEGPSECEGVEKCLLISYSFYTDKDNMQDYIDSGSTVPELDVKLDKSLNSGGYRVENISISGNGARVVDPKTMIVYSDSSKTLMVMDIFIDGAPTREIKTEMKTNYFIRVK